MNGEKTIFSLGCLWLGLFCIRLNAIKNIRFSITLKTKVERKIKKIMRRFNVKSALNNPILDWLLISSLFSNTLANMLAE